MSSRFVLMRTMHCTVVLANDVGVVVCAVVLANDVGVVAGRVLDQGRCVGRAWLWPVEGRMYDSFIVSTLSLFLSRLLPTWLLLIAFPSFCPCICMCIMYCAYVRARACIICVHVCVCVCGWRDMCA